MEAKMSIQLLVIGKQTHALANAIRAYVRKQKKNWQKIPYLSLMEQGRSGWSDSAPYQYGYFILNRSGGSYGPAVDCETGELVDAKGTDGHEPLSDYEVVRFLRYLDNRLVAADQVAYYEKRLNERISDFFANGEPQRQRLHAQYSFIKPNKYKRPSKRTLDKIAQAA